MLADRVDGLTLLKNTRILEGDRSADVASYGRDVAPEIQEQLLFLPPSALTVSSKRHLRAVARLADWEGQTAVTAASVKAFTVALGQVGFELATPEVNSADSSENEIIARWIVITFVWKANAELRL